MNPAIGGKPPSDRRNNVIKRCEQPWMLVPQPGIVPNLIVGTIRAFEQSDDAKRAQVRDGVGEQIEQHGAFPNVVPGEQGHQQISPVRNARVSQHALDARLGHADDRSARIDIAAAVSQKSIAHSAS